LLFVENGIEYHDFSDKGEKWVEELKRTSEYEMPMRPPGAKERFPIKLHAMLEQAECTGFTDVIRFQPHGRAFKVCDKKRFTIEILPCYFTHQKNFASFQRQLNIYGFLRMIKEGPDQDSYYHEFFLRGRQETSCLIRRNNIVTSSMRRSFDASTEPNFYNMTPLSDQQKQHQVIVLQPQTDAHNEPQQNQRRIYASSKVCRDFMTDAKAETGLDPLGNTTNYQTNDFERAAINICHQWPKDNTAHNQLSFDMRSDLRDRNSFSCGSDSSIINDYRFILMSSLKTDAMVNPIENVPQNQPQLHVHVHSTINISNQDRYQLGPIAGTTIAERTAAMYHQNQHSDDDESRSSASSMALWLEDVDLDF
jgi:HSF-type DNA-binding